MSRLKLSFISVRSRSFLHWFIFAGVVLGGCASSSNSTSGKPSAPSITTQPQSQSVVAGQSVTFDVVAAGTAPLIHQWSKNGSAISGATQASYTTPPTTASDNGEQFTVAVSNTGGTVTSNPATLTVVSALQITSTSLPSGQVNVSYSTALSASGGTTPYTWSIASGSLPSGLSFAGSTGTISGTPTASGQSQFTIEVSDSSSPAQTVTKQFTIVISPTSSAAPFGHVAIIVEENANYADVVGSASMPYLNSLISQFGLGTQYYANTHPSIGNYMMLTTGQVLTNDDSQTPQSFPVSADNVVTELIAAGKTWKSYAEDLPSVGYIGGDTGEYAVRHNPLAYMTVVQNNSAERQNLAPFTQFASDLSGGALPNYAFIVPNLCDDAHDCALSTADSWLKTNIQPLIANFAFQKDGLLVIVFDESGSDNTNGGGRVAAVLISPAFSKSGYKSTTLYQHQSVLRLMLEGLGVTKLPGAAASAPPMWEFFTFTPPA